MQLIYGKNSVEAYLTYAPSKVKALYIQEGLQQKTIEHMTKIARKNNIQYAIVPQRKFETEVPRKVSHQGLMAQVEDFHYLDLDVAINRSLKREDGQPPLFVLLDQVQDPRNLGAMLRTADCAGGIDGFILTKNNSAEVTAAAISTSTGAALNVPVIQVTNARNAIKKLKDAGIWICTLNMEGAKHYREENYRMPMCLVVGGEDVGVRPLIEKESDFRIYIPMQSKTVNSLNVSVATALLLYEIAYQREQ